ncbi:serine hydrolase, partial [Enterococcus faecalis]|uniref:serine hydrolase n=1 Tax=Enterococcus faecalis TaxID=1351 RepID=UPI003D6C40CF
SGEILWSQQPDLAWNPDSIAKVMTMYLAFEAMEQGKFPMDRTVTATQKDVHISKIYAISNNKIRLRVAYPVRELLKMIA